VPTPRREVATAPLAEVGRHTGRLHWLVTALVSLAFASNAVDLAAISFALPGMRREWNLSPLELGFVTAAVSAGQVCGSLLIGWLGDHMGRRRVLTVTIALAAAPIGLSALAPNAWLVTMAFFASGLGISGVTPVATSMLGELAPPRIRGQLMAWTQVCWSTGWCLTAAGGAALVEALGWRWILALGGLPIVLALVSWNLAPESPRYLLAHGRRQEAEALVQDLETRHGVRLPLPDQQQAERRSSPLRSLRELWSPVFRRRTVTLWLVWFAMVAAFNGPIIWLPAILSTTGGNEALAARSSLIIGLFMLPASLGSVLLIDRAGRRPLLMLSLGAAALGAFGLAIADSEVAVILAGGALAGGTLAAWPIILGYTAELYPTRVRATAAGWAGTVSRTGGVVAPLMLGVLLSSWGGGLGAALGIFGAMLAAVVVLVMVLGEETSGRALEDLSS
jgi:putative MFS transporter